MPQRSPRAPIRPKPGRREVTDRINRAFESSDIDEIRHAIDAAIRRYNISDIATMGFQLHVTVRRKARARLAPPKAVPSGSADCHE